MISRQSEGRNVEFSAQYNESRVVSLLDDSTARGWYMGSEAAVRRTFVGHEVFVIFTGDILKEINL